ncbi:TIGR03773 family transporter-associated surface protein [Micromonospora sp. NPDC050397]|uniref:TIGR03773 family transporter-associated surface protein n=1 Tax=Micromonospora sp. NPDC050397 TaxID=3364279 RepID=UPI00384F0091
MLGTARLHLATLAAAVAVTAALSPWALPATEVMAAPPASTERTVVNDGHTDVIDLRYVDGDLRLKSRIGNAPDYLHAEPDEVLFQLLDNESSAVAVPDIPEYGFLGPVGAPLWLAPQTQVDGVLWPGWDTESLPVGLFADDVVDLHLRAVRGPGRVEVFQWDEFGMPIRTLSSVDPAYGSLRQAVNSHVHANWAFSALGRYTLTFEATATLPGGAALRSGPVDYTWYVGGTAAGDVLAEPTTTTVTAAPPVAPSGSPVALTGTVAPAGAAGWIEFLDGDTPLGFTEVGAAGTATLTTSALAPGEHPIRARFSPRYGNDYRSSTSTPLTYRVTPGQGSPPPTFPPTPSPTGSASPSGTPTPTRTATGTSGPPRTTGPTSTASARPTSAAATTPGCVPTTRTSGVVLRQGHVDYAARIVDGRLVSQIKDGTGTGGPVWRSPAQVVLQLRSAAAITIPTGGDFGFLGPPAATVWQIPQTQKQDVLWAGWNTEELKPSQVTGPVTWKLTGVSGPGAVAVYQLDAFGKPMVVFDSANGLPDGYDIPLGTHAHGNWAFTRPGGYRLTFTQSARLASGSVSTDTQVLTVAVGDTDPAGLLPKTTASGCGGTGGQLPTTGTALLRPIVVGAGLLVLGTAMIVLTRVRRRRAVVDGPMIG